MVTARDFGFLTTEQMIERMTRTVETIERMERWHGHLYNWYETTTLRPLPPRYVVLAQVEVRPRAISRTNSVQFPRSRFCSS